MVAYSLKIVLEDVCLCSVNGQHELAFVNREFRFAIVSADEIFCPFPRLHP